MINHGDMAEMGLRSGTIKDFTSLEAVAEHLQAGNYRSMAKRNQKKKKEENVSLILQGLEDPTTIP